ncbi:unnamed protein product [Discula destructiva]
MAFMTIDSFPMYDLRKDVLLNYLQRLFSNSSGAISVEIADTTMYTLTVPRQLTRAERAEIVALREPRYDW